MCSPCDNTNGIDILPYPSLWDEEQLLPVDQKLSLVGYDPKDVK